VSERNIRLLLAFDGTAYSGWQRQKGAPTIQETIEHCLTRITGQPVTLHGAGRTDAGVHALGMVANFHTLSAIPCSGLRKGLNSMLPPDIRILEAVDAPAWFHSRYSATGKTYRYALCTAPVQMPTERLYTAHFSRPLDVEAIRGALALIAGSHDFSSFEGSGSRDRDAKGYNDRGAVRTLRQTEFTPQTSPASTWFFRFTGDGFLRHMVRNLVGTLLLVGCGKITPADFAEILRSRDRGRAGATAPAHGLFLERVYYGSPEPSES